MACLYMHEFLTQEVLYTHVLLLSRIGGYSCNLSTGIPFIICFCVVEPVRIFAYSALLLAFPAVVTACSIFDVLCFLLLLFVNLVFTESFKVCNFICNINFNTVGSQPERLERGLLVRCNCRVSTGISAIAVIVIIFGRLISYSRVICPYTFWLKERVPNATVYE